ncbi:MAG: cytochrome P450 [Alphaproteobacteria bacterium]
MSAISTAISENTAIKPQVLSADVEKAIQSIPDAQINAADADAPGLDPLVSRDPWTHFRKLRAQQGDCVQYVDGRYGDVEVYNVFGHDLSKPNFAVLGYDAIRKMCMDRKMFINSGAYGMHAKAQGPFVMVNEMDGEQHKITRRLFDTQIFSKGQLLELSEEAVGPMAHMLAQRIRAKFDAGEEADLCRDLALPLVYSSIARIIGVPLTDISYFVDMGERAFGGTRDPEAAMAAVIELTQYFQEKYEARKQSGDLDKGDLMSMMSTAEYQGHRFNEDEIVAYCRFLLPGGIETTWRQTANLGYALMTNSDQYQKVVADPSLIPNAVEEACRWMASGFVLPRIAAVDTEIDGVRIPAGSSMVGVFGVANREDGIWESPDEFDVTREKKLHLTFSTGSHACMGQHLARLNFVRALEAMVTHLPDMVLACDPAKLETVGFVQRCPRRVPVTKSA